MKTHHIPHLNTPNTGYESRRIIDGKTFHVLAEEVPVNCSVEEAWAELSGNFVNGAEIAASLNASHGLTGDLLEGLGAERYLNIDFMGTTIEAKERIIDFRESEDVREFTYDVYETIGAPLGIKTYNTWYVRRAGDAKTYLGSVFILRANFAPLTGLVAKKLAGSGSLRTGLLTYKHVLETGEKKVDAQTLDRLYPASM
jgi:hypothetical protein